MANKPMLSVPRELLEELRNVCGDPELAEETRLFLDKPVLESQYDGMTKGQAQAVSDGVDEILHGKGTEIEALKDELEAYKGTFEEGNKAAVFHTGEGIMRYMRVMLNLHRAVIVERKEKGA